MNASQDGTWEQVNISFKQLETNTDLNFLWYFQLLSSECFTYLSATQKLQI